MNYTEKIVCLFSERFVEGIERMFFIAGHIHTVDTYLGIAASPATLKRVQVSHVFC